MTNPLPQIQFTDFYRFLVTLGAWLAIALFILYLYKVDTDRNFYRIFPSQQQYNDFNRRIHKIDKRLYAIKNHSCSKSNAYLSQIATCDTDEERSLLEIKRVIKEEQYRLKKILDNRSEIIYKSELLDSFNPYLVIYIGLILSFLFIVSGLFFWWKKIQKPAERTVENDLKIQRLTIEKLKYEVSRYKKQNTNS